MTRVCETEVHERLKRDSTWPTLPFIGVTVLPADEHDAEERIEFRNCACGSTLARKVPT